MVSQALFLQVKGMEVDVEERPKDLVRKPYVVNGECGLCSRPPSCLLKVERHSVPSLQQ